VIYVLYTPTHGAVHVTLPFPALELLGRLQSVLKNLPMENLDFQRDFTSPDTFSHLAGDPTRCHEPIQEASCKLLR
jgi:hypothetical protein